MVKAVLTVQAAWTVQAALVPVVVQSSWSRWPISHAFAA